jgi:hypothetical protein
MIKVLPLKDFKSLRAFNAFHKLMLGLKMLPAYMEEPYEDFFSRVQKMNEADQIKLIREAALFVDLEKEELDALVCFSADKNGVPYTSENMKNLGPADFVEIIVAVCFEIAKIKVDFVSDSEKKN